VTDKTVNHASRVLIQSCNLLRVVETFRSGCCRPGKVNLRKLTLLEKISMLGATGVVEEPDNFTGIVDRASGGQSCAGETRYKARYSNWLDGLLADCAVLDISEKTTLHCADINLELRQAEHPIPTNDLWIAALCRQHRLSILSRDRHFDLVQGNQRLEW